MQGDRWSIDTGQGELRALTNETAVGEKEEEVKMSPRQDGTVNN